MPSLQISCETMMLAMHRADLHATQRPARLHSAARNCLSCQPMCRPLSSPALRAQAATHPRLRHIQISKLGRCRANFLDVAWGVTGDLSAQVALHLDLCNACARPDDYNTPTYLDDNSNPDIFNFCAQDLAASLFSFSIIPYAGFLYHLTRSKKAPPLALFGFYFLLVFVFGTIPAGILGTQAMAAVQHPQHTSSSCNGTAILLLMSIHLVASCLRAAKTRYGTTLANVDFLHGPAESLLTITNLLIGEPRGQR
jgi:Protein of unknown function (DUF3593)